MYMYLHFFQLDARFKKTFYRDSLRVQKKKILRSLTLARKYRYLCTNIHQYGILETTIILSWFTAVIKLMIVLPWSLNGRCSWKRSIYIQKKNSKILFACMYSWFFSILPSYYCTCGTLVKNMIYRRQCTQKSPRHNIGKKNNYQLLPKELLKIFFQIRFNNGLL